MTPQHIYNDLCVKVADVLTELDRDQRSPSYTFGFLTWYVIEAIEKAYREGGARYRELNERYNDLIKFIDSFDPSIMDAFVNSVDDFDIPDADLLDVPPLDLSEEERDRRQDPFGVRRYYS